MIYSLHRFGCMFDEYFLFGFQALNHEGRRTFVTDKTRYEYYAMMNSKEHKELFDDKKKAYDLFRKYYKRDLIFVKGEQDIDIFREFAEKHNNFLVKPYNSGCGRGIRMMRASDSNLDECFNELLNLVGNGVVCEELIHQSSVMSEIHPQSVNTVRIPTIRTKNDVIIFHPFFRTGSGDSLVDNASSGGIFSLPDPETGIIFTKGKTLKGDTFLKHPDSGIVFPGFRLPDWDEAVAMVKELAHVVSSERYIGWDLAHTDKGWIMVEGNASGDLKEAQCFSRTGVREELEKYINDI